MSSKEIITDEMRSFIGLESDPVTYVVEKHSIEHFARAIGESNPIYFDEQFAKDNVGGIIAPPTFIRLFRPKRLEKQFPDSFSNLVDGGSSYTFHEKIFVGDQITVVSKLKDLFIKSGSFGDMMFKISLTTYTNQKNILVAEQEITTILYGKGEKTFLS
ncbi:MAG: MaoC family dehydratase N-terminal domain-containing protein [Chloroflexota bacterium]|jgi:acyl dehydratase|nr:dehydratase [Chloroflexota bacterium]MQF83878.1 MaoC family dehydratase [SAR202 cluster bacterium]GIS30013.1 MAG: dehydratase [Dehalococcoidia bacterium]MBL06634.1 dehydratase [Chloroflexota bacterium]MEC7919988.1 MaoC family dehydratase N-terminal domain-containing protein [Chloroflexota bacterium]|tara:strand:- start:438 stop:914 length:477 start_codon:yes stop_codon:yes gene_type:complete